MRPSGALAEKEMTSHVRLQRQPWHRGPGAAALPQPVESLQPQRASHRGAGDAVLPPPAAAIGAHQPLLETLHLAPARRQGVSAPVASSQVAQSRQLQALPPL
mmetsp:Transcript_38758/g.82420  ORF Transcript_38758/g.82420 Transcript_38758/m.82420 type:complete len:103 (+) Transcript_38758:1792-2100(+)